MCFVLLKGFGKPLIAEEDMICWKVMLPNYDYPISPARRYLYAVGELNKEVELRVVRDYEVVEEGYHSFHDLPALLRIISTCYHPVYECIIPKGSKYYRNDQEYVSSQIIIKSKLN